MSTKQTILPKSQVDVSKGIDTQVSEWETDLKFNTAVAAVEGGMKAVDDGMRKYNQKFDEALVEGIQERVEGIEDAAIDELAAAQQQRDNAVGIVGEWGLNAINSKQKAIAQAPTSSIKMKYELEMRALQRDLIRRRPDKAAEIMSATQRMAQTSSFEIALASVEAQNAYESDQAKEARRVYIQTGVEAGVDEYLAYSDPAEFDRQRAVMLYDHQKAADAKRELEFLNTQGQLNAPQINKAINKTQASAMSKTRQYVNAELERLVGLTSIEAANEFLRKDPESEAEVKGAVQRAISLARSSYVEDVVGFFKDGTVDYDAIDKQLTAYDAYNQTLLDSVGSDYFRKQSQMGDNILNAARNDSLMSIPEVGTLLAVSEITAKLGDSTLGKVVSRTAENQVGKVIEDWLKKQYTPEPGDKKLASGAEAVVKDASFDADKTLYAAYPDASPQEIEEMKRPLPGALLSTLSDSSFDVSNPTKSKAFAMMFHGVTQDNLTQIERQRANSKEYTDTYVEVLNHPNYTKMLDSLDSTSRLNVQTRAGEVLDYELHYIFLNETEEQLGYLFDDKATGGFKWPMEVGPAFKPEMLNPNEPETIPIGGPSKGRAMNPNRYMDVKRMMELTATSDGQILFKAREDLDLDKVNAYSLQWYVDALNERLAPRAAKYISAYGVTFDVLPGRAAEVMVRKIEQRFYN